MQQKTAQLLDVALKANVAKSTVAAALRPGGGGKNARVSEKTAERIRRIARELGYRPDRLASALRGASTSSVAAVWQFVDPWCLDANIGNELLRKFQEKGLATYQAEHPNQPEQLMAVLDDLLNRRPDALIIRWRPDLMEHAGVRDMLSQFKAVLAVVPWRVDCVDIDQVVHDRDSGIREAIEHFARIGRKRVSIILNMRDVTDRRKYAVFLNQCRRLGLAAHPRQLIDLDIHGPGITDRIERYTRAMSETFTGDVNVDAILVVNDLGVMTVAKYLRDHGVHVGQEVSLVGLNNPPHLSLWEPPLATIDRNQDMLLDTVYELITERISHPDHPPQTRCVPMHFIWRESAGGPPPEPV